MTVTIRRLVCWCLMLILPMQAMAGMLRMHVPNADPTHERSVAQTQHGEGVLHMGADHHALATHASLPSRPDCGHHVSPACPDCHAAEAPHDSSDRHASCHACALCCLLLIPSSLSIAPPAGVSSTPPASDTRFRSVAPHVLERPPRPIAAA